MGGAQERRARVPFGEAEAKELQELWAKHLGRKVVEGVNLGAGVTMKFVLIPPGKYLMGSPRDEVGHEGDEGPQHEVEITQGFYMGMYPVMQAEYETITGKNPSYFCKQGGGKDKVANQDTGQFPVEQVSWEEAVAFCESLTKKDTQKPEGWVYALPTEAEWEYACRAGTKTAYSFGDDPDQLAEYAWYLENSGDRTHAVGTRKANQWGLHDMHGNVWQWCADWNGKDYYQNSPGKDPKGPGNGKCRVLRGGSWNFNPRYCRAAYHNFNEPGYRYDNLGFRVVLRAP
jgi:formylglycine-generating enzyme required for sulfatase activity